MLLNEVDQLPSCLDLGATDLRGSVRLGSTQGLATRAVIPSFSHQQKANPHLDISFVTGSSTLLFSKILSEEIDLAICCGPLEHPSTLSRTLFEDPFGIAVRKAHPILSMTQRLRKAELSRLSAAAPRLYRGEKILNTSPLRA